MNKPDMDTIKSMTEFLEHHGVMKKSEAKRVNARAEAKLDKYEAYVIYLRRGLK